MLRTFVSAGYPLLAIHASAVRVLDEWEDQERRTPSLASRSKNSAATCKEALQALVEWR
jgi:hypothetical protein